MQEPTDMPRNMIAVDSKSLAIGILSLSACVFFVGLILVTQTPAQATGMNDRGGDYIMLTQQISNTSEAVVVIDAAAKRMLIYGFDYNTKSLEVIRGWSLDQLPKPQVPAAPPGAGRGK
jgi:hypothetical protein